MGNTLSNHLTFPFQVKELPAERSAVEARIVFLERHVFLLGRWLFVLGALFLLPAGRLHWVIYLGYAALCLIYTLGLLTPGRASRRIALAQGMTLADYGFVIFLIVSTGGLSSPLQLFIPVLFFRNQLLLHGLPWARWDGLAAAAAWLVSVKIGNSWLEIVLNAQSWSFLIVLGACAGLAAFMVSPTGSGATAPARTVANGEPGSAFSPAFRARLVEEVPGWVFLLDRQGRFVYLNRQFEDWFPAFRRDQYLGHRLQELVWPPDGSVVEELLGSALALEGPQSGEVRFSLPSGGVLQLRLRLKPLALGKSNGLLGVGQEVEFGPRGLGTEEKLGPGENSATADGEEERLDQEKQVQKLVKELRLAEEQIVQVTRELGQARDEFEREGDQTEQVLAALSTGLLQVGPDFRLRGFRGPAKEWFGLSDRQLGLPCASALWQIENGSCPGCKAPALGQEGRWEDCSAASGRSFRRLRLSRSNLGGAEAGWFELIQPKPEPESAPEAKARETPEPDGLALAGRVAGSVAHEFNNIFSAIQGFAVLAEEDENYVKDLVQTVKGQSQRGERLNRALLHLVRGPDSSEQVCDLKTALEEAMLLAEREYVKRGLRLRPLLGNTARIEANPAALSRLFLRLLLLLAEAMPKESELVIQTRRQEPGVEVLFDSAPSPLGAADLEEIIAWVRAEEPAAFGKSEAVIQLRVEDSAPGRRLVLRLPLAENAPTA